MQKTIIGVDLGATSGRVILARVGDGRLSMEEVHRFANRMTEIEGHLYWDIHALFEEILQGLHAAARTGEKVASIGIDTWGVDFACFDAGGRLLGLPRAYRDPYTDGVPERLFQEIPRERVYEKTGIQVMNFNSLYQLYAQSREEESPLRRAERVLFMPDALSYLLTGEQVCERTILSTSQLMVSLDSPCSGELAERRMRPPSASMSKRTDAFCCAMTETRLSAAEKAATSISTAVAQVGGRSCL